MVAAANHLAMAGYTPKTMKMADASRGQVAFSRPFNLSHSAYMYSDHSLTIPPMDTPQENDVAGLVRTLLSPHSVCTVTQSICRYIRMGNGI